MSIDNLAAAIEIASAGSEGAAPAPEAPTPSTEPAPASQPVETPAAAPSEPAATPAPTVDRVTLDKLRERQAAKAPPQRQAPPADPDFAEYQAWRAARQATQSPGIDPRAFKANPIAALEAAGLDPHEALNLLTKHAVTPDAAAVESRVDAKIRAAEERAERAERAVEEIKQARQANAQQRGYSQARAEFVSNTVDKGKFPHLAKLGDERRADLGAAKARELVAQGIEDFSLAEVADLVEGDLHSLASELLGSDPAADAAKPTPSQPATNGRAPQRAATITSDAAASTSATPRSTSEKQRLAAAIELARRS